MTTFTDPLWGYQLTYPDDWVQHGSGDIEAFSATQAALNSDYTGPDAGHLLIRGEFNHTAQSIDPLWNTHIAKISLMVGAKDLGSAPLALGGRRGYEAEIVLPKQSEQRLWTGILTYGLTILHLMVKHPLDQRDWFEPQATQIVASLRFLPASPDLPQAQGDIPLPQDYSAEDPAAVLSDVQDQQGWQAFTGDASIDALQAFYVRELPNYGWEIHQFTPYPNQIELTFARLHLRKGSQAAALGLLPTPKGEGTSTVVIKR